MKKFIFASIVIGYGIISSVVMLPLSIFYGLFGLFWDFWRSLLDGVREYCRAYDEAIAASKLPFSWSAWAEAQENPNHEPKDPK